MDMARSAYGQLGSITVRDSPGAPLWDLMELGNEHRIYGHAGAAGLIDKWVRFRSVSIDIDADGEIAVFEPMDGEALL